MPNADAPRGRDFDRNALDKDFKPADVGHPIPEQQFLPDELTVDKVEADLGRKVAALPVDHLSINVLNGQIREIFTQGVVFAARIYEYCIARADAAITNLNAAIRGIETQADTTQRGLDEAIEDAATIRYNLDGDPPVPINDPDVPRVPPRLGPSLMRRCIVVLIAAFGLVIDVVNFKGVLDLLNSTVTEWENRLLATGFATAAAGMAVITGTAVGRRRRGTSSRRWTWFGAVIPTLILLAMITTSLLIRALNVSVLAPTPFDDATSKPSNPFGGASGWLSAIFYTAVLVASVYATFDESRTVAKYAPYYRVRRQVKGLIKTLRKLQENLEYALGLRSEWMSSMARDLRLRNVAIIEHASHCNQHYRSARERVAQKVGDPVVSDAIEHAPTIDLSSDVPPLVPPFKAEDDGPAAAAAAA